MDLNVIKQRLASLNKTAPTGGNNQKKNLFWKPSIGKQTIRIVPTEDGDPFKDYHFHYMTINGKNNSVMCPKRNFGEA